MPTPLRTAKRQRGALVLGVVLVMLLPAAGATAALAVPLQDLTDADVLNAATSVQGLVNLVADNGPGSVEYPLFLVQISRLQDAQRQLPPDRARPVGCYDQFVGAWSSAQQGLGAQAKAQAQRAMDCYVAALSPASAPPQSSQVVDLASCKRMYADTVYASDGTLIHESSLTNSQDAEFERATALPYPDQGTCNAVNSSGLDYNFDAIAGHEYATVYRLSLPADDTCLKLAVDSNDFNPDLLTGFSRKDLDSMLAVVQGSGPRDTQITLHQQSLHGTPGSFYYLAAVARDGQDHPDGSYTLYIINCAASSQ